MALPIFHVPGPCIVYFGTGVAPTDSVGETKAGVIITPETHLVPIVTDEYGDVPIDYIFTGKSALVECVSMVLADLLTCAYFRALLGKDEAVGTLYNAGSTTQYSLKITERVVTDIWQADCCFPLLPTEIRMRTSQELQMPLRFQILPDDNGALFTTVPAYLV